MIFPNLIISWFFISFNLGLLSSLISISRDISTFNNIVISNSFVISFNCSIIFCSLISIQSDIISKLSIIANFIFFSFFIFIHFSFNSSKILLPLSIVVIYFLNLKNGSIFCVIFIQSSIRNFPLFILSILTIAWLLNILLLISSSSSSPLKINTGIFWLKILVAIFKANEVCPIPLLEATTINFGFSISIILSNSTNPVFTFYNFILSSIKLYYFNLKIPLFSFSYHLLY